MMYQKEIQFFWPLTEQIPLDLDYSNCGKPQLSCSVSAPSVFGFYPTNAMNGNITITAAAMNLDVDTTTIKMREKPNLCRRTILKCLGLKWELK